MLGLRALRSHTGGGVGVLAGRRAPRSLSEVSSDGSLGGCRTPCSIVELDHPPTGLIGRHHPSHLRALPLCRDIRGHATMVPRGETQWDGLGIRSLT